MKSPFNNHGVEVEDENVVRFIVGGHFHGASTNTSGFPASTMLGGIDIINAQNPDFIISLGDMFLSVKKDMKNYPRVLFDKLNAPLFNAVGNHDVEENNYKKKLVSVISSSKLGVMHSLSLIQKKRLETLQESSLVC